MPGVLGILEPRASLPEIPADAIDWALIPGVAFDDRGYRLGRGAGHYDRLLPGMRPDCICWAVCLSCQLVPSLPVEPHDVPLEGITAPHRTIRGVGHLGDVRASSRRG
jgi:5-formyltetrahydrofolate cyclo-ligase